VITMAIGDSGRPVQNRTGDERPLPMDLGHHVHKGAPEATVGGPGATAAPGASREGSSGMSPYGTGGDGG